MQTIFAGDCQSQYLTMMKALSVIKQLRIEINKFHKTALSASVAAPLDALQDAQACLNSGADRVYQSCFGCIQEYLQALLNFIQLTAAASTQIRERFASMRMARQLYAESLRMFN